MFQTRTDQLSPLLVAILLTVSMPKQYKCVRFLMTMILKIFQRPNHLFGLTLLTAPHWQRCTPVAFTGKGPVFSFLDKLTEPTISQVFRNPINLPVVFG